MSALKEIDLNYAILEEMQSPLDYQSKKRNLKQTKVVPILSRFLRRFYKAGDATSKIAESTHTFNASLTTHAISYDAHIAGIAIAGLDFFRIPAIYLIAFLLNEKVPFTVNNNLKWLYSGAIVALMIVGIAVPAAAPVIAFIVAGLGVALSGFLLAKKIFERVQLGWQLRNVKKSLRFELGEMESIQKKASQLQEQLGSATDEKQRQSIYSQIALLKAKYDAQKIKIQELTHKKLEISNEINSVKLIYIVDKGLGVLLGSATIIGLALLPFFPPAAGIILLVTAITGGVYIASRILVPIMFSLGNWIQTKLGPSIVASKEEVLDESESVHESMVDVMHGLEKAEAGTHHVEHSPRENSSTKQNPMPVNQSEAKAKDDEDKEGEGDSSTPHMQH